MTTTVTIAVNEFTASGPVALLGHSITFKPVPIHIDSTTDTVLSEDIWEVAIVDGVSTTLIPDSVSGYGVRIGANIQGWKFVTVANYPVGTISLADLVNNYAVNPTTLEPTPAPDSWWTALANLVDNSVAQANQYTDTQIANVTSGIDADIADAQAAAVTSSNGYTDTKAAAAVTSSNGYTDASVAGVERGVPTRLYVSPTGNDANSGKTMSSAKLTLQAAVTLMGSNSGVIEMDSGTISAGIGITFPSGVKCSLIGQGPGRTILTATAQVGAVLDYSAAGYGFDGSEVGGFTIKGDGTAGSAKKGLVFSSVLSNSRIHAHDILVYNTGGAGIDLGALNLSPALDHLTVKEPINAAASDIPYVMATGPFNGNKLDGLQIYGISAGANVGPSGAVVITDSATYPPSGNTFSDFGAEYIHVPTNGTIFAIKGNENAIIEPHFFDCSKASGATGTSHIRLTRPGSGNDSGGNTVRGEIPGSALTGVYIDAGVDIFSGRNLVEGVKSFKGANVVLESGAGFNVIKLKGMVSGSTNPGVIDNSGVSTNIIEDDSLFLYPYGGTGVRRFQTGRYYGAANHGLATGTFSNGYLQAIPFWVPVSTTFVEISCEVTTLAAATNVRLGIYANDPALDKPGALVLDAGTVDASTVGVKAITISQTLQGGQLYWLAAAAQGGNPLLRVVSGSLDPVANNGFAGPAAATEVNCYYIASVTGALPTPWSSSAAVAGSGGPKIMLKVA